MDNPCCCLNDPDSVWSIAFFPISSSGLQHIQTYNVLDYAQRHAAVVVDVCIYHKKRQATWSCAVIPNHNSMHHHLLLLKCIIFFFSNPPILCVRIFRNVAPYCWCLFCRTIYSKRAHWLDHHQIQQPIDSWLCSLKRALFNLFVW